ncbi:stress-inducible protein [Actinidia rufa]|uniref:Stress-inducible protein n=1 Tax=Actinidia rufa TaxID=165716 RepID=A0A7J0DHQ1_9ERIC|nr:stress-inducible protein [Actinidia rufa]
MADEAKAKGNASFTAGDYTDAIHHFTEAISLAPDNHVLYSNRSSAHASARKFIGAFSNAEKAVEIKPDWPKGYYRVGTAHMGLRRYDDAVSAYKNGLEIDPNNEALKSGLAAASGTHFTSPFGDVFSGSEMWARLDSDPTTRPSFNRAISRIRCWTPNSSEDADIPDAEMTEEDPEPEDMEVPEEEREARERKKEAHKEKEKGNAAYKKDFEAAIQHYAKAIELDDKDISFLTNRAVVYLEMGQGLGNNKSDYEKLEVTLKGHGVPTVVAKVSRIDWLRNAAGLADPNYWRGTLRPRPVLDWYLKRVDEAVNEAKKLAEGRLLSALY